MATKSVKLRGHKEWSKKKKEAVAKLLAKRGTLSPLFKTGQSMVVERPDLGLRRFQSTLCLRQNCGRTYGGRERPQMILYSKKLLDWQISRGQIFNRIVEEPMFRLIWKIQQTYVLLLSTLCSSLRTPLLMSLKQSKENIAWYSGTLSLLKELASKLSWV